MFTVLDFELLERRPVYPVPSKFHQTLLSKSLFEHGTLERIALVTSSSRTLRNSSLAPQLLSIINDMCFLAGVFDPKEIETVQFTHQLVLDCWGDRTPVAHARVNDLLETKYFRHSLRILEIHADDEILQPLLRADLVALEELKLIGSGAIPDEIIDILNDQQVRMPRLRKVTVTPNFHYGAVTVTSALRIKQLHTLSLERYSSGSITSAEVFGSEFLDHVENLRCLHLRAEKGFDFPNDESLNLLSENPIICENLESFSLLGPTFSTDQVESFLACLSSNFTELKFDYLPNVSIDRIFSEEKFAGQLPPRFSFASSLTSLSFDKSSNLSDATLFVVAKHLPQLRNLSVGQTFEANFTFRGLVDLDNATQIQSLFPSLTSLSILEMIAFSLESLHVLTTITGKTLRHLTIRPGTFQLSPYEKLSPIKRKSTWLKDFEKLVKLESLTWSDCFTPIIQFEKNISFEWRSHLKQLSIDFRNNEMRDFKGFQKQTAMIYKVFPFADLLVTKRMDPMAGLWQMDEESYTEEDYKSCVHGDTDESGTDNNDEEE